jgi:hypothetical protein
MTTRVVATQRSGYSQHMDIWERIRYARDRALNAEETERQRLADADTAELQQAASVRLATRQAVREALDDVLDEESEPAKGNAISAGAAADGGSPASAGSGETAGDAEADLGNSPGEDTSTLVGTATTLSDSEAGDATSGGEIAGDVEQEPGSQEAS